MNNNATIEFFETKEPEPVDLVIIGHLAFNEDHTPAGTQVSVGGAAYYCAVGASVDPTTSVGIVASIGSDFDIAPISRLGMRTDGVTTIASGHTAHFIVTQYPDNSRRFEANWGVADLVRTDAFPDSYLAARHIHLATAPPWQQLRWLEWCRALPRRPSISVDAFEHFVQTSLNETRQVLSLADLVFINEDEATLLGITEESWVKKYVLKLGPRGARYCNGSFVIDVPAPAAQAIDTTGAGDVLAGAFLVLRNSAVPIAAALHDAVELATASVRDFGVDHPDLCQALARIQKRNGHRQKSGSS